MSDPQVTFHISELIAAVAFVVGGGGAAGVIAKHKGWITFGEPTERRGCRDLPGCPFLVWH